MSRKFALSLVALVAVVASGLSVSQSASQAVTLDQVAMVSENTAIQTVERKPGGGHGTGTGQGTGGGHGTGTGQGTGKGGHRIRR